MGNVTGYFRPIKHQNHLSRWASDWILETIFGEHDEGVILGGHDHEGCDVLHRRLSDVEQAHSWHSNDQTHDELKRRRRRQNAAEETGDVEIAVEENFDVKQPPPPVHETQQVHHPLEISQYAAHVRNNLSSGVWKAEKYTPKTSGIREITVRSMMGDFSGNVGLLTGSYNHDTQRTLPV
jgi:hypothetical protein